MEILTPFIAVVAFFTGLFINHLSSKGKITLLEFDLSARQKLIDELTKQGKLHAEMADLRKVESDHYTKVSYNNFLKVVTTEAINMGMVNVPKMELEAAQVLLMHYMVIQIRIVHNKPINTTMADCRMHASMFRDIMDEFFNEEEVVVNSFVQFNCDGVTFNLYEVCSNIFEDIKGLVKENNNIFEQVPD